MISAIVAARESMAGSGRRLNQAVTDLVARAQQPLEQPALPALPAAVLEQAPPA